MLGGLMNDRQPKVGGLPLVSRYALSCRCAVGLCAAGFALAAPANPHGMTVTSGTATAVASGSQLTVTASQNALLNWQSFNIAAGESTTFQQPNPASVVWNQIGGASPSQIWGNLNANGTVVLMNSSGFFFGPNSEVKAAGFVATTAAPGPNLTVGSSWEFNGAPPAASIINYGKIGVATGGSLYLTAAQIDNHGILSAPGGNIGLFADRQVLISDRPDGRGLNVTAKLPTGSVNNDGQIIADGGSILASAQTVNQNGLIQANSVREKNGVIELVAGDAVNLGANSLLEANGDSTVISSGGQITVKSDGSFSDATGSVISATGGAQGGNGGKMEISAPNISSLNSTLTAAAQPGYTAGRLSFDPYNIILDTSGTDSASGGTVVSGSNPVTVGSVLDLNVNTAFVGFSQITLQAVNNITLAGGTGWSLSDSTGQTSGKLTLQAGNNIIFQDGSYIYDANNWSVKLQAGVNFTTGLVQQGVGSIYLNGGDGLQNGGSIQTTAGSITLEAGKDVQTGSGYLQDINFNNIALAADSGAISVTAGNNIQIGSGMVETTSGGSISLTALTQTINVASSINTANGGDITLTAAQDINMGTGAITASGGDIIAKALAGSLNIGSEFVQTDTGSITLQANQNILVGSGAVTTVGGGSIDATATLGSVDTGTDPNGYTFSAPNHFTHDPGGAQVASGLGGISTGAGGNLTIYAGQNVTSYLPKGSTEAGSGAFGSEAGDVSITAKNGNVTGHYVVANGTGTIIAGGNAGISGTDLALSLIKGSWSVNAGQNIVLQEVRNPNGIFNLGGSASTPTYHEFNYGANDSVTLSAGNSVDLAGDNLPRNSGEFLIPPIYPPSLTISAGAGGITFGSSALGSSKIILFSSPEGSLNISTFDGGSLVGPSASNPASLIMSDSGQTQAFNADTFGIGDHAAVPVHLNSQTLCYLNISGSMNNIYLVAPEAAQVTVGGDMNNCAFQGQNLHSSDVTKIDVTGNIFNVNNYNSVTLKVASAPDFSQLNFAFGSSYSDLFNRLFYNAKTGALTIQGVLTSDEVKALFNLSVQAVDSNGQPEVDPQGNPILQTVHILNPNDAALVAAINQLQTGSAGAPSTPGAGYVLGGPGIFQINAHNIDLGATQGIQTVGPLDNPALAPYCQNPATPSDFGATIKAVLTGNLDMFSTTICSLAGGDVSVTADKGYINVGAAFIPNDVLPRGIFSAGQGNVTVEAGDNIDINGSRIAAYDGGGVTVKSLTGDVNAGSGGQGACTVEQGVVVPVINPNTGKVEGYTVETYAPTIPGSGILATTFPQPIGVQFPSSQNSVGDIHVDTPQGNIIANAGGIVQLPLNGVSSSTASVTLNAGTTDAHGNVIYKGSIDATGSGVIGANVNLTASAGITGVVIAQGNLNVTAVQNVNVTAVAVGNVNVAAGGTVSGTIVGVGGISASGSSIDASLLSQNVSTSGGVSGQVGFAQANVAGATSAASSSDDQAKTAVASAVDNSLDDNQKNKKRPGLIKTGRVTVVLPNKT